MIARTVPFAADASARSASATSALLEIALDVARWVRASAIRTRAGLVWPSDPERPEEVSLNLYSGAAGIVLFLLEAYRATGDEGLLEDAERGASHLLGALDTMRDAGLYTGLGGVGFALGEVFRVTRARRHRAGLLRVVRRLVELARPAAGGVEWGAFADILSGTAGTGSFLLYAARAHRSAEAAALALGAGTRLLELATPVGRRGLRWEPSPGFGRSYPNFAHGTAGVAYFLAALAEDTRDRAILEAAVAGAEYLKSIANTDGEGCTLFHHTPGEGENLFYLGFCHGPPGAARLWYRLHRVTRDPKWLAWTERSARGVLASGIPEQKTPGFWGNAGACCGSASVAAFFLRLYRATSNLHYLDFARRMTRQLLAQATRDAQGTRWAHAEFRLKPQLVVAQTGWMQGAAGIGAWLLELDAFERGRPPRAPFPDDPF